MSPLEFRLWNKFRVLARIVVPLEFRKDLLAAASQFAIACVDAEREACAKLLDAAAIRRREKPHESQEGSRCLPDAIVRGGK